MAGHFIAGITFILWDRAQPLFLYSQAFVYITETLPERLDVRLRKGPQTTNVSHLVPLFYLRQENSESPQHNKLVVGCGCREDFPRILGL